MEEVKKALSKRTHITLSSTLSSVYDQQEKLGEAFRKGIEDGLKGEQIMADMNKMMKNTKYGEFETNELTDREKIHLVAIDMNEYQIQMEILWEMRGFLKKISHAYIDRGDFNIVSEITFRLANIEKQINALSERMIQIKDDYGNDMRYNSRFAFLANLRDSKTSEDDVETPKEDSEPAPKPAKKTKKPDGDAN